MNLFNNIQKVKYTRNQQEVVALKDPYGKIQI